MSRPPAQPRPAAARVVLAGLLLGAATSAQATFLGSPDTFEVNINSSGPGTFGEITLAGVEFDLGIEIQRQHVLGSELGGNPTVTIVPGDVPRATYTTTVFDFPALEVTVDTSLLGPLRDTSRPNMLMRQTFTVTNNSTSAMVIDGMSLFVPTFADNDVDDFGGDETARGDADTGVVYATETASTRLAAMAGNPDDFNQSFEVAEEFLISSYLASELTGATGPIEDTYTEMGAGLWTTDPVAVGDSVSMRFSYLFSLNETTPPDSFPAPAAATGLLLLAGAPALTLLRRRRNGIAGSDRRPDSTTQ